MGTHHIILWGFVRVPERSRSFFPLCLSMFKLHVQRVFALQSACVLGVGLCRPGLGGIALFQPGLSTELSFGNINKSTW